MAHYCVDCVFLAFSLLEVLAVLLKDGNVLPNATLAGNEGLKPPFLIESERRTDGRKEEVLLPKLLADEETPPNLLPGFVVTNN